MRSVLCLFLIVADASEKLHRQKTHRSNEPESDYNASLVNEKYSTLKTFQLHSQLTQQNRQNRELHNSNYFEHDRKKKKQFVGVKIVLKLRKIPHISVKAREQLRKTKTRETQKNASMSHVEWKILSALKITMGVRDGIREDKKFCSEFCGIL